LCKTRKTVTNFQPLPAIDKMTPTEFKNNWTKDNDSLFSFSEDKCKGLNLKQETIDFLTKAGLPDNVAPYLSFVKDTTDLYDGINRLTIQYNFLDKEYDKFIAIGSDGSGNPIAINTKLNDRIEWLDHDNYFSASYMNNSIYELANILLIYRDFVTQIQIENGEDALLDSNFTDIQFENLKQKIFSVDNKALIENGFWKNELDLLLTNRQYFIENQ